MKIKQIDPSRRDDARQFLQLPFTIYRSTAQWVPPLEMDAKRMLDKKSHPFYNHSDAAFFMAEREGRWVGRLAVLDNRHYNEYNHESTAFFYLFECENDSDAAMGLFSEGEAWARGRHLTRMIGPKGFTALDGMGLLVKGYEHRPALGIPYNLDYYSSLVEKAGFEMMGEMVSGYLSPEIKLPEKIFEVAKAVQERKGLRIARFNKRSDLRMVVPKLKQMYNGALEGTTGNTPLTDEEALTLADQLLWFADPSLIKIIMKDDEAVGFLFAYPDISAALQRTGGRLFPLGWLDLLLELRRTKWININGAGLVEKYRGMGGTALLFAEMYNSIINGRYQHAEMVQVGMENDRMQNELRNFGIDFNKLHRMYHKQITS